MVVGAVPGAAWSSLSVVALLAAGALVSCSADTPGTKSGPEGGTTGGEGGQQTSGGAGESTGGSVTNHASGGGGGGGTGSGGRGSNADAEAGMAGTAGASKDAASDGSGNDGGRIVDSGLGDSRGETVPYRGHIQILDDLYYARIGYTATFVKSSDYVWFFEPACTAARDTCCFASPEQLTALGNRKVGGYPVDAGEVLLKSNGATTATLTPVSPSAPIYDTADANVAWQPGALVTMEATGGTVHAFSGSVTLGTPLSGVQPSASPLSVALSSNLDVSWTPDTTRTDQIVYVRLNGIATVGGLQEGEIECVVDDTTGKVTIPAMLFGQFHAGDRAALNILRYSRATLTADNVAVDLMQASFSTSPLTYK